MAPGFVVTLLARGVLDDPAAAGAVLTRVPMGRLELPPGGRLGHRVPVWPRSGLRQQSGDPRRRRLLGSLRPALRPVRARAVPPLAPPSSSPHPLRPAAPVRRPAPVPRGGPSDGGEPSGRDRAASPSTLR
ncbi:hypothetical protein [Streptomyces eurythermus]|uniref:hypothetical protein n=1 Tax=Streptomyces eurythermus TaxID=42237 RepID=UPI003571370F